ncbi:MAG: hypothetical protein EOO13_12810 [Chitinophagaceae bacterium]|nr:MAG: hypothetical protein EOO13_12810 [Chitinophagaceae bacterium]
MPSSLSAIIFLQKNANAGNRRSILFLVTCFLLLSCAGFSQPMPSFSDTGNNPLRVDTLAKLVVTAVEVTGNKKTKTYIIEREIRFKAGDTLAAASLYEKLEESRSLIYNTNLFTEVTLTPRFVSGEGISILVTVKERWYIYPTPQFQLSDRNLNEWIERYNADLNRVTYGLKFAHYNLSGRRDQLRVYLLNGFSRNISMIYAAPYSNRRLTEGFSVSAGFSQSRAAIFRTNSNNLPLRYSRVDRDFVRQNLYVSGAYISRKGFYRRHVFSVGYGYNKVEDSVVSKYNPAYYNNGDKNYIGFPELGYSFQYIHTNNINFPLTGKIYSGGIIKRGLGVSGGVNMLTLSGTYSRYLSLGKNWYHSVQAIGQLKLPFKQPYFNQAAMGYGEFYLRGLENYVIDGVGSMLAKYTLKKKIIAFDIPVPFKNKIVPKIPFQFFAKSFADAGYSYNKFAGDTRLGNKLLYTGGFGLDMLTLYDINFSFEYSFNQLGQKGLFLHARGGF